MLADGDVAAREQHVSGLRGAGPAGEDVRAHRRRPAALRPAHLRRPGHRRRCAGSPGRAAPQAVAAFAAEQVGGLEERCQAARAARPATTRSPGRRRSPARCPAEGYAASASTIASGGQLCQHHCPVAHVAAEFPQLCEAETAGDLAPGRHARAAPRHHRPRRRGVHHPHPGATGPRPYGPTNHHREGAAMTEQTSLSQAEQLADLGRYEYGWADLDTAGANARRGPQRGRGARHLGEEERAASGCSTCGSRACACSAASRCRAWGADLSGIDFDNIKYFVRSTEKQAASWDDLPADIKNTYDRLGIPEAEKQRLVAGVAAQYESEVVYHKIREDLEQQGVLFLDTDTGLKRARGHLPGVLRHGDPGRRQQVRRAEHRRVVRRLVHLRAQGRQRGDPAAGVLPDQHREHGPVRADADHRRRGRLRALRRGLHRADLLVRLAAQRGRRDHREEGRPLPLHDHPELVEQRLQPGHQAGGRATRARRWSGSTATSAPR